MVSWQIASSMDKEYIFELATAKGWYEDPPHVQVRTVLGMDYDTWYVIEPYEKDCNCPQLVTPPEIAPNSV